MRELRRTTAALALAAAIVTSGFAQQMGAPADVPRNHWAFSAVDTLFREGLLKGYPDGSFRGGRPVVRYELVALQALNLSFAALPVPQEVSRDVLNAVRRDLELAKVQMNELREMFAELPALMKKMEELNLRLRELRRQVDEMKGGG
ncbi:MAG TPA: S-layer homology domain-containing protein [Fimbriimonadaceae bacterium]|nr:S-layer homology domain-containing protein [Fimbriimonadaceae bacterium]